MNLPLRLKLIALGSALAAVWLGALLAEEAYALPFLVLAAAVVGLLVTLLRTTPGAIILGLGLFGYLVGNRGFAQFMPMPAVPLLPAELILLLTGGGLVLSSAVSRRLPLQRDGLNVMVLAWLAVGPARIAFDVHTFGLLALRDYAMTYYALFFFLAQQLAQDARSRRFLVAALGAACLVQPLAVVLSSSFPVFFLTQLVVRGVPLIYFKGDLAMTFMGVSAVVLAAGAPAALRLWVWPLATLELVGVISGENRASMLGAGLALAWLAVSRLRRFALVQAATVLLALLVVAGGALLTDNVWAQQRMEGVTGRILSLTDLVGQGPAASPESAMKSDNNRFRTMWWRAVASETLAQNPAFGLGFGYDLARGFLQEYSPDLTEEFTARSPHSILMSAFGRLGFAGLAVFAGFCGVLAVRTWRVMRDPAAAPLALGLWSSLWVILLSACFGVVLEGPMGAVVFWTLLGLANARSPAADETDPPAVPAG